MNRPTRVLYLPDEGVFPDGGIILTVTNLSGATWTDGRIDLLGLGLIKSAPAKQLKDVFNSKFPTTKLTDEAAAKLATEIIQPKTSKLSNDIVKGRENPAVQALIENVKVVKLMEDGLVHAEVLPDDSPKYVSGTCMFVGDKADEDSVEISIESCEGCSG